MTRNPAERYRRVLGYLFQFGLIVLVSGAAVFWGGSTAAVFWQERPVEELAKRIVAGNAFRPEILDNLLPELDRIESQSLCRSAAIRSAAIVRLRMAETAIAASERQLTTDRVKSLRESIRKSISCAPPDAFLWFILYWIEIQNSSGDNLSYLRMSYRFGPNEGWVGAKRNGFTLAIFDQLPDDLKASAVAEFAALVDSGFTEEAVANLTGPGWAAREALLAGLADVKEGGKRRLANALRRRGIRLALPGLEQPELRPWN